MSSDYATDDDVVLSIVNKSITILIVVDFLCALKELYPLSQFTHINKMGIIGIIELWRCMYG